MNKFNQGERLTQLQEIKELNKWKDICAYGLEDLL